MQNDKKKIITNNKLPKSIRSIAKIYPSNQVNRLIYGGLPHLGNALWGTWSSDQIQKASEAYEDYSLSTNLLISGHDLPPSEKIRLGGGSPARLKPFKFCTDQIKETLDTRILSDYPLAAGDDFSKLPIIEYFNNNSPLKLNENNIIFTHSSTQGFTLVMESILDYGDVVIMTAPNYGLFSFIPERVGGRVKFLNLEKSDDWKINPSKLKKLIEDTNSDLQIDYDRNRSKYIFRRSDSTPRVAAFVNLNPHNPTGVVYSDKDFSLLSKISEICNKTGVFIIDDLAYQGLEYDRSNPAFPISYIKDQFDNTISLYTLSKSYGLAGIRAGMVIANEIVSSVIRDRIFQVSDSLSILQASAISAAFNPNSNIISEKEKYFEYITKEYLDRYIFVKAILIGKSKLTPEESSRLHNIIKDNKIDITQENLFQGIDSLEIVLEPQSGFFVLLNLKKYLGKSYRGFRVLDDKSLLKFLYTSKNIKVLTGNAFCWPKSEDLVIRVTTAMSYGELTEQYTILKESLSLLES